jgi:hypothetical protein
MLTGLSVTERSGGAQPPSTLRFMDASMYAEWLSAEMA